MISIPQGKVVYLSPTYEGSVHDKKICNEEELEFPEGIKILQDLGFQGHQPKNVTVEMPKKNTKLHRLTEMDKKENKEKSSKRVKVEHTISGIKRCRILKDEYRNRRNGFEDTVMLLCCGLHNFRIKHRQSSA